MVYPLQDEMMDYSEQAVQLCCLNQSYPRHNTALHILIQQLAIM